MERFHSNYKPPLPKKDKACRGGRGSVRKKKKENMKLKKASTGKVKCFAPYVDTMIALVLLQSVTQTDQT